MMAYVIKTLARISAMLACGIIFVPTTSPGDEPTRVHRPILASLPKALPVDPLYSKKNSLPDNWESHPLTPALNLARVRIAHIQKHVKDFTCVLVKRERINGQLRDYEYLATKVRREQREDDEITTRFAVYTEYLGPAKVRGRKVLFVDGENEGKMLVRNGGTRFNYINVKLDPTSPAALRESRYPITELRLDAFTERLIDHTLRDIRNDPEGKNSRVEFFHDASVEERPCLHIQVVHAERHEDFSYHMANIYIDNQLHMPIRIETYDWPKEGEDEPVLQEEYTFTRLHLNVGLTDADFSPSLLESK